MEVQALKGIDAVKLLTPRKFGDHRGFFAETYNRETLRQHGIQIEFVQDNHALSGERGTLRGLHYQRPPLSQDKLLRVLRGRILDVAVDLRRQSGTYGKHVSQVLSAEDFTQILVPTGFAHGFIALEDNTEITYKVSNYYSPEHDAGLMWNDPDLGIDWTLPESEIILSDKDQKHPAFRSLESPF